MGKFEFLEKPFDELKEGDVDKLDKFQKRCKDIATSLFRYYGIKCGDTIFRFSEIEFYYYEKGKWEEDWNKITYARDGYKGGDLFFHLSGVDICFDSSCTCNNGQGKFGGILVRSIIDESNNLTTGPLNTMSCILNKCKGSSMPCLVILEKKNYRHIIPMEIHRALGKKDMEKFENNNKKLCFYDGSIREIKAKKMRYFKNPKGEADEYKEVSLPYNRFKKKL